MTRTCRWAVFGVLACTAPAWSAAKYSGKVVKAEPPKGLKESIRKLLGDEAVQVLDAKGEAICQVWFCKEVSADGGSEPAKAPVTYRQIKETAVLGAIEYLKPWKDYRKQKIKKGVYTLRLAFQPSDGNHMGASTYTEFCLLVAADMDDKADSLEPKALLQLSTKSIGTAHPGCLMLFPYENPKGKPQLVGKGNDHWVVNAQQSVTAGGKKIEGGLGVGLTVVGEAAE
jgi:hypothetical protein